MEHSENADEMHAKVHTDLEADSSKHLGGNSWGNHFGCSDLGQLYHISQ